jgi:hypothetical protein
MDKQVLVQIIQTTGVILSPLLAICLTGFLYLRIHNIRKQVSQEGALLKEALFYRYIIGKYAEQSKTEGEDERSNKNKFWAEARIELGMPTPSLTEPNRITERLRNLELLDEKLQAALNNLKG